MKKLISFILTAMMVFTSAACNRKNIVNPAPPNVNKSINQINKDMNTVPNPAPPNVNKSLNQINKDMNTVPNPNIGIKTPIVPTTPVVPPSGRITVPRNIGAAPPITGTATINRYKNGTFIGRSDRTKSGYGYARITIAGGKITGVELKRCDAKGKEIKYTDSMRKDRDYMVKMIKEKQGLNFMLSTTNLEAVNSWKTATEKAINKAKLGQYKDGTFIGMSDKTKAGYAKATIIVKNGKVTNVSLKKYNEKGKEIKYTKSIIKDRNELIKMLKEKQIMDSTKIGTNTEIVSEWKVAITRALEKAKR